jgi:hypothetical protein
MSTIPAVEKLTNHVKVFEVTKNGKPYIQFDFKGHLDIEAATGAITTWREVMDEPTKKESDLQLYGNDRVRFQC